MSYYEPQSPAGWQTRPNWDSRSGTTTPGHTPYSKQEVMGQSDLTTRFTQMKPEDPAAFGSQIDEVDRAVDNLAKSGKMFNAPRRDSLPMMGGSAGPRGFPVEPHDSRMINTLPVRHYSVPDFEAIRSHSAANLQNFYATQRFQSRQQPLQTAEPETIMQAKRRAAAQRERELRNYHQEQQYNRTVLAEINTFGKDRVMSPGAMSEEDRRDLIARQHRALYSAHSEGAHSEDGNSNIHYEEGSCRSSLNVNPNGASAPASNAGGTRVHTPATEQPPSGNQTAGVQGFSNRTSASSPGDSPPRSHRGFMPTASSSVAPIGTRPTGQAQNPSAQQSAKRASTPLTTPLGYSFGSADSDPFNTLPKERSASAASTEQHSSNAQNSSDGLGWSKVWGPGNKGLNNVASVWG